MGVSDMVSIRVHPVVARILRVLVVLFGRVRGGGQGGGHPDRRDRHMGLTPRPPHAKQYGSL